MSCPRLREHHQNESGSECIRRQLDRGRWTCGLDVDQKAGGFGVVVVVEVLGDVD